MNQFKPPTLLFRFWKLLCPVIVAASISTLGQSAASRPETTAPSPFSLGDMFTVFFLMLGPIKILAPFVQMTRKGDAEFVRRFAFRGFVYSCFVLLLAAVIGENFLRKFHISVPTLEIAAGLILFLVALREVLHRYDAGDRTDAKECEPDLRNALSPLAFPTIVTSPGVAAVIVFMSLTSNYMLEAKICAALLALMLLNLVAMLFAKTVLKYLGTPLALLGVVLGVIQIAFGLQIVRVGLRGLGLVI